jgi:hypothetical protein
MISSRTKFLTTIAFGAALLLVAAESAAAQAPEGIKIHGDWVLEVRNADGSLAERRAFKNALQPEGKRDLAALLGRGALGYWRVNTYNTFNVCLSGTDYCSLREPDDNSDAGGLPMARTVTVAVVNDQTVLRASFVANGDGQITAVSTQMMRPGSGANEFTMTGLATPVAVQATQSVSLTVTFSFQ